MEFIGRLSPQIMTIRKRLTIVNATEKAREKKLFNKTKHYAHVNKYVHYHQ